MIRIDHTVCDQCGTCVGVCPTDALTIRLKVLEVDNERCTGCLLCTRVCPVEALGDDNV
jgi:energy-converting hydrogenase A subunit Q